MTKSLVRKKGMIGTSSSTDAIVTEGSKNPFVDLGFGNPELELAKSKLVMEMAKVIDERDLSQARAGEIIGLPQPKLSQLLNGHWTSYSVDRLTRYLNKLGVTVRITLERTGRPGKKVTSWWPRGDRSLAKSRAERKGVSSRGPLLEVSPTVVRLSRMSQNGTRLPLRIGQSVSALPG